jgi:HSP20 family molecular chaperone IbpA
VDPEKDVDISSHGSFQRSIPLPEGVDAEQIKATYENGILEVVVPQAAQLPTGEEDPDLGGRGAQGPLRVATSAA